MKNLIVFLILTSIFFRVYAQENKIVTITSSGSGPTQEAARKNALRNAVEQTFGVFISSNTQIFNDELTRDEIVSISNGNIHEYKIISEIPINNDEYNSVLSVSISLNKLNTFCENKGIASEFKGSLFSYNIKLQQLNEEVEYESMLNLFAIAKKLSMKSFDYAITIEDPVKAVAERSYQQVPPDSWQVKSTVTVTTNNNWTEVVDLIGKTLISVSMSQEDYRHLQIN